MIGRTVGHYRILEHLGGGGMGVVYKAEDLTLGRHVALKFLPPELTRVDDARKRFLREARAASQLDHQNLCTVYEVGESDGQTWIAMACYDGETLKAKIERGPMPVDDALELTQQIARGIAKAHAAGILHRDIKPANVMVTSAGVAKIVDFGLAKLSGATHITQANTTLGTIAYMAPEQLRGEEVGPPADLWAAGVVLFELLTTRRPFRGDNAQAIVYAILNEQPAPLLELRPDAPPELDRIVKKLLRKDPLQRYQEAEDLLTDLGSLCAPSSSARLSAPRRSAERESLRTGARLGPYEIVELLGSGGVGDVYRARDTRLDRQVAIKVLAPEFSEDLGRKQRFQREAKTISSLSHANICTLFDVGEQEGTDYLVMEYLEGETLAARLAREPFRLDDLLKIGIQISEALGKAHQQGVIHRDLKPANVMLTVGGVVKLLDFGLAKGIASVLQEGSSGGRRTRPSSPLGSDDRTEKRPVTPSPEKPLTAEGAIVGTLPYMAPEQVEGLEADARSDVFSLGTILYEMATGRRAFAAPTKASLIAAILTTEPAALAELRSESGSSSSVARNLAPIERAVRQCLEKDPDRRWQSALDVANELRWIAERRYESHQRPPGVVPAKSPRYKFTRALTLAAIVAASGLAVAAWITRGPKATPAAARLPELVRLTWETGQETNPQLMPDGASFVYERGVAEASYEKNVDIFLRRVGGETAINLTKDSPSRDLNPAISPDGQLIAFRSQSEGAGIFVMGATGESRRRLTKGGWHPAFSPDGKRVAYSTLASHQEAMSELRVVDVATGDSAAIYKGDGVHPSWSPTGSRIAFSIRVKSGASYRAIATIPAKGGEPIEVISSTDLHANGPVWKGDWLWYASSAGGTVGLWRVRVDEATGARAGEPEQVFRSTSSSITPSLSGNGKRLVFSAGTRTWPVYRWDFDPARGKLVSAATLVTAGTRTLRLGNVSSDGAWLAMVLRERNQSDLVIMRTSDGETRRLTHDSHHERNLQLSRDGSKIFYVIDQGGASEILSIRADGSGRERVASTVPPYSFKVIRPSPDGRRLFVEITNNAEEEWRPALIDLELPLDKRKPVELPRISPDRVFVAQEWSPDGRAILGFPNGEVQITFVYDVETRTYRKVSEMQSGWAVNWLPDSRRFLHTRAGILEVVDAETGKIEPAGTIEASFFDPKLSDDGRSLFAMKSIDESDVWMLELGDDWGPEAAAKERR